MYSSDCQRKGRKFCPCVKSHKKQPFPPAPIQGLPENKKQRWEFPAAAFSIPPAAGFPRRIKPPPVRIQTELLPISSKLPQALAAQPTAPHGMFQPPPVRPPPVPKFPPAIEPKGFGQLAAPLCASVQGRSAALPNHPAFRTTDCSDWTALRPDRAARYNCRCRR